MTPLAHRVVLACVAFAPVAALAAGGPFEVDDAAILDPGRCQVESWLDARAGAVPALLHLGPGCRVGAAEVGLNLDATRADGRSDGAAGVQSKWRWAPGERVSVAAVVSATTGVRTRDGDAFGGYLAASVLLSPALTLHANAGADAVRGAGTRPRIGASLEWAASERDAVIVEAMRRLGGNIARVGVRHGLATGWTLDLAAAAAGSPSRRIATVGLTREFGR